MPADAEQMTAEAPSADVKTKSATTSQARRSLAAAETISPVATGVAASVAAAQTLIAAAGPTGWGGHLEARNILVDFINAIAAEVGGNGDTSLLAPAEALVDELETRLLQADDPRARPAQLGLAVRLNAEGFANADHFHDLGVAGFELEAQEPEHGLDFQDAHARWEAVHTSFLAAEAASDEASEAEADDDDLIGRFSRTHDAWRVARRALMGVPAPHWAALAEKARVVLVHFNGLDDGARWARAGRDLIEAAKLIGLGDPKQAQLIDVMQARGFAEQIPYFLARRPDGYADWACGGIVKLATEAEMLATESRDLAEARDDLRMMSGKIISAVWFTDSPKPSTHPECPVDDLSDEWSTSIRMHDDLDARDKLSTADRARLTEVEARMEAIREEAFEHLPLSKSGVAFQLLAAGSFIDHVRSGSSEEIKDAGEENVRKALANAVRVLGLPFDYRAPQYFLGPHLDDLDGSRRAGPAR